MTQSDEDMENNAVMRRLERIQANLPDEKKLNEMLDRTRRIETRLTRYLEQNGFETGVQRPVWNPRGGIDIPTRACSIHDMLAVVPADWNRGDEIIVRIHGEFVMAIYLTTTD